MKSCGSSARSSPACIISALCTQIGGNVVLFSHVTNLVLHILACLRGQTQAVLCNCTGASADFAEALRLNTEPSGVLEGVASGAGSNFITGQHQGAKMSIESLSIVIPVFNEEFSLCNVIADVHVGLAGTGIDYEIVVVDDGSRDSTWSLLCEMATADPSMRIVQHGSNKGKGQALRTGMSVASKQWLLLIDADLQIRMSEFGVFRDAAGSANIIIGYRQYQHEHSPVRHMVSWGYRLLVQALFSLRVRDCGCPFKLVRNDTVRTTALTADGFGFDAELLWKIALAGERIVELPVLSYGRTAGVSKVTVFSCLACTWELLRIRLGLH